MAVLSQIISFDETYISKRNNCYDEKSEQIINKTPTSVQKRYQKYKKKKLSFINKLLFNTIIQIIHNINWALLEIGNEQTSDFV